jgi:hypothetical protein
MKIRSIGALAVGAAIGYAVNTPTGRAQLARLRVAASGFMGRPEVRAKTADLAEKAKQKTGGLPDPVQDIANSTIDAAAQRAAGQQSPPSPPNGTASPAPEGGGTGS